MNQFFPTLAAQGFNMIDILISFMFFACAIYGLYTAIRVRVTYMLFPNKFLFPGNCSPEDCLDEDGFIDYIIPRLAIWSVLMLLVSVAYTLNNFVFHYGGLAVEIATVIIPILVIGWLMVIQRSSAKRFWGV